MKWDGYLVRWQGYGGEDGLPKGPEEHDEDGMVEDQVQYWSSTRMHYLANYNN